ncbi:MAG TPA: DNA-processing protein DprA [Hanamia sp.]|nr:DNA-processing protein DprA [Hanamia sp.]
MQKELLYQIALTLVPNIGDVRSKGLIQHFGDASAVFHAQKKALEAIEGIGLKAIESLLNFKDFKRAEEEIGFIKKYNITPLFLTDKNYPQRLLNCYDSPPMLYYKGNANLNSSKIVAIVGTRNNNEYGKNITEKLVDQLANEDILIVSGLAFGIDSIAHKSCIKNNVPTIGVLAHGLDRVYPAQNASLAKQMISCGGLLTEFKSNTIPDKQNFPGRNRIVAGISDCVIVVESGIKGGSLITAELANGYNKDVFAIPGRVEDSKSSGCNYLIKNNKAMLITSADDILDNMGWKETKKPSVKKQRELFIEFSAEEKVVVDILQTQEQVHIDELYFKSKLSSSTVAQALLMLEMQGIVASMPGKMYRITP